MECGREVLHGTWLVVCYGVDFWVHTSAAEFCKLNQTAEKKIPFHAIWGPCSYNFGVLHRSNFTAYWNGPLRGFLLSWALRSSQHIISQSTTSHNHIASHHMSSQPTNNITTSITTHPIASLHIRSHCMTVQRITPHHVTLQHITSHRITSHPVTSHHITSCHITPHHKT